MERRRPGRHWVLVLDDYHAIVAPEVHEAMTFLLDYMPVQLHLLVATRSDPPFPLSRLRSRGQLTEVRAGGLRFAPAEARAFLNEVMGLIVYGMGVGYASAQLTGLILADVPVRQSGQASGTQSTARQIGAAMGTAILGTVLFVTLNSQ